ncbi:MAG: hypothetical protein NZM43_12235 [Saprospiraceae bacterium]|nr:hypothetical protein [Saprospiraceae bacterium]MDW8485080.1 hypothetical protein [Saprospiraceae bacterium]
MSIATLKREIALEALAHFQRDIAGKDPKPYLNAVQKALLLLGSQGLCRAVLYITAQMSKNEGKQEGQATNAVLSSPQAYALLYAHLAKFLGSHEDRFQGEVLCSCSKETIARKESEATLFLLYIKRLAESQRDLKELRATEEKR